AAGDEGFAVGRENQVADAILMYRPISTRFAFALLVHIVNADTAILRAHGHAVAVSTESQTIDIAALIGEVQDIVAGGQVVNAYGAARIGFVLPWNPKQNILPVRGQANGRHVLVQIVEGQFLVFILGDLLARLCVPQLDV